MAKVLKIFTRTLYGIIEWVLLFVILFAFFIRTSPVQTFLAERATAYLSEELGTVFTIDKVDITFIDRVDLKGIFLMNQAQTDTIASIKSLLVDVDGIGAFNQKIHLNSLLLEDGIVKIEKEKATEAINLNFIIDYFKSSKPKKKKKTLPFYIDKVALENVRFQYDNSMIPNRTDGGMDYQHLKLDSIFLKAKNVGIVKGVITADLKHLEANEKCGFKLSDFKGQITVSNHGVDIKNVNIHTPLTDLNSKRFQLLYTSYTQFKSFVDSVAFDADVYGSTVSFIDIARFAPQLQGMDQQVSLEGKVTKFVKNLRVEDLELHTGDKTVLKGTINLPDFRDLHNAFYQERIDYAFIDLKDLQAINLPKSASKRKIELNESVNRLGYFEGRNIRLDGIFSQFVLSSSEISTRLGSVNMSNGILFTYQPASNSFLFSRSEASEYDVKVNEFDLGGFIGNKNFGVVDGVFFLTGEARSFTDIDFTDISGDVKRFDLADYSYSNIRVENTSFIDKILYAEVNVEDNNLTMNYAGTIDLNGEPKMNMEIDLDKAMLGRLNITESKLTNLVGKIRLNTVGVNPNTMSGTVDVVQLHYVDDDKKISIPRIALSIERSAEVDFIHLNSSILDATVEGKANVNNIGYIIQDQVSQLFPGLTQLQLSKKDKKKLKASEDCMVFDVKAKDMSDFLAIFMPRLTVSPGTTIKGDYDASKHFFLMDVYSDKVSFDHYEAKGISLSQTADYSNLDASYRIQKLKLNDSITLENVHFSGVGNGDNLESQLTWNPTTKNATDIQWTTHFETNKRIKTVFKPSYFAINEQKWEIGRAATIILDSSVVDVSDFKLISGEQYISADGRISKNDSDQLAFKIHEVDLEKLGHLLGLNINLNGQLNGLAFVSNPYTNFKYFGDVTISELFINGEEVGNVVLMSQSTSNKDIIEIRGDLDYRSMPSFSFEGTYDLSKKTDNMNFDLVFDKTNISVVNAFMDPLVMDDIKGELNGRLHVSGGISRPILEGKLNLDKASLKMVMLGTTFSLSGPIEADADGFYINHIPISDAEGNTGSLIASIYHNNFKDWNFDVSINAEEDYYKRDRLQSWVKLPLEKFLVLNTDNKRGDVYYGKAYATGTVGIFGYLNNLEINVDVKTQKGTNVVLDFFSQTEITENNIIEFKSKNDTITVSDERKINYSGVSLNLNFDVTRDAAIRMIINEQTGDEITATGRGKLSLGLDRVGQMSLDGTYTIADGSKYNFVLGPIRETFYIKEGSSIAWTGNPFQAALDLQAYYTMKASLGDLSPELLTSGSQDIHCYLNLTESLMKPAIDCKIDAPKAAEKDKSLLAQLTADKDELNRQFFSLLLWKKFQPIKGSSRASGGAALDLASNQINSLLDQVSQDFKVNVNMNADDVGRSEYEVGVKKGFLDDQLVISGSFGARNQTSGNQTQSSVIGDIEIEYKLNKDGTFRINVFNESNDNRGLQSTNRGMFKQGVGLYYKESFNTFKDFKLYQQFLDIFRKKQNKRYPVTRKKQQTPVPGSNAEKQQNAAIKPKE